MYGAQQPLSLGQIPSGIAVDVGSTQLASGAYYTHPPPAHQYAANSNSRSVRRLPSTTAVWTATIKMCRVCGIK